MSLNRRTLRKYGLPGWAWRAAKRSADPARMLAVIDLHGLTREQAKNVSDFSGDELRARACTWDQRLKGD